jgi:hypothetical protein
MSRGVMFKFPALCHGRRTQVRAGGWHLAALCRAHLLDGHANFDRSVPQLVIHNLFLPIVVWAVKTIGMHHFLRDGPDT